jgi:starvation-inducible DNA-binding protein
MPSNGQEAMRTILNSFSILIQLQRDSLEGASAIGDEGTHAVISDYSGSRKSWFGCSRLI